MTFYKKELQTKSRIVFSNNGVTYTAHKPAAHIDSLTIDVQPKGQASYRVHIKPVDSMVQYDGFKMPWRISGQPSDKNRGIANRQNLCAVYKIAKGNF